MKQNNRNRNTHRTGWQQEERAGPHPAARARCRPCRLSFAEESASTESSCARKATWRFLLRDFAENRDDQDEVNFVRLVWSPILSGMTKVTLSASESICPPCEKVFDKRKTFKMEPGEVEFSWTSRCGRTFRVLAYSEPSPVFHQYDLQIDGESFVDFPLHRDPGDEHRRHITRSDSSVALSPKRIRKGFGPFLFRRRAGLQDASPPPSCTDTTRPSSRKTIRTPPTRGGVSPCNVAPQAVPPLLIERPSKMLSSFDRSGLFQSVPSSFAGNREGDDCADNNPLSVLSAFSNKETIASCFPQTDVSTLEANAISDAYAFVDWDVETGEISSPDSSAVVSFLQQQLNFIIRHVQCDIISSEAGARIFHNLQKITGFPTDDPIPLDTVVLVGIGAAARQADIRDAMIQFGPIESLSPTVGERGIAICRFKSASSSELLVNTSRKGGVFVQGAKILAMYIQSAVDYKSLRHDKDTEDRTKSCEGTKGALPRSATQPQRNVPSATQETPFSSPLQKPFNFLRRMFKSPVSSEEPKRSACDNLLERGVPALPLLDHDAESLIKPTSKEPEGSTALQNQPPGAHRRAQSADFRSLGLPPLERSRSLFDSFRDAPLEEFRVLVKTSMNDCEGMLSLALTNALIESTPPSEKVMLGNSIEHEAMLMHEVFTQIQSDKTLYDREELLQRVLNKAAIFVRNREISPHAASRIVSFSAEVLCHDCPPNAPAVALAVVDANPGTKRKDLLEAFGRLGEALDATIVDEGGGFGLVLFKSHLSCPAASDFCANGVTVNGKHLRPVLIRSHSVATCDGLQELTPGAKRPSLFSPSLGGADVVGQEGGTQDGNLVRCLPGSSGSMTHESASSDGCGSSPSSDPDAPVENDRIETSDPFPTSPRGVVSDPSSSSGNCGFETYPPGGKDSVPCFISSKRLLDDMPSS